MSSILVMLVLFVPLFTTAVVAGAARREDGTPVPFRAAIPLLAATALALAIATIVPISFLAAVIAFVLLFALAIRVMQATERAVVLDEEPVRTATLEPRRIGAYVPYWYRGALLPFVAWAIDAARTPVPRFTLVSFTGIAVTFFLLYEAWIRQEIFDVRGNETDRRRRVRFLFVAQMILAISFLTLAALSARPEPGRVALGVAAVLIGTPGCALALSTGVQQRYLRSSSSTLLLESAPPDDHHL